MIKTIIPREIMVKTFPHQIAKNGHKTYKTLWSKEWDFEAGKNLKIKFKKSNFQLCFDVLCLFLSFFIAVQCTSSEQFPNQNSNSNSTTQKVLPRPIEHMKRKISPRNCPVVT